MDHLRDRQPNLLTLATNGLVVDIVDCAGRQDKSAITSVITRGASHRRGITLTVTTLATIENHARTESQNTQVGADAPASRVDGTSLGGGPIELELPVGHDRADPALLVGKDAVAEVHRELVGIVADGDDGVGRGHSGGGELRNKAEAEPKGGLASRGSGAGRGDQIVHTLRTGLTTLEPVQAVALIAVEIVHGRVRGAEDGSDEECGDEGQAEELHLWRRGYS